MKNLEKFTDHELIDHTLEGESAAYGELYNRYYRRVYQKCVSLVKDNELAFDLAEEAILKALNNLKSFRGDAAFATWLYIIVHRHCLEFLRKESKHTKAVILLKHEQAITIADETSEQNEANDQMEQLMMRLIERLPEKEKQLLMLKYVKGESIEDLQKMFHLSASAIKMRLKRTKDHLQQLYLIATAPDMQHRLAFV